MSPERRQFLGWGVAAAGATLAPGFMLVELAQARSPQEAASKLQRWGLLIDITKCADCDECVTACHEENGVTGHGRPQTDAQWIRKVSLRDKRTGYAQTLPLSRLAWQSTQPFRLKRDSRTPWRSVRSRW